MKKKKDNDKITNRSKRRAPVIVLAMLRKKGVDQLRGHREADLRLCFRICKKAVFSQRGSYNPSVKLTILISPLMCLSLLVESFSPIVDTFLC